MTKGEVAKILAVLAAAYPKFEVDDLKVQVWHEMLGDLDYAVANMAVKKLIMQNTFPPAIAEVRKAAAELTNPENLTSSEAWGEVTSAIRNYGYYREGEALASMSLTTAQVVRYMGWREICMSEDIGVIRGQFLRMYEAYAAKERQDALLPDSMKETIRKIGEQQHQKVIEQKEKIIKGLLEG